MIIDMPQEFEGLVCQHCGSRLKAVFRVIAGEVEYDLMETRKIKGNMPDWFNGILSLENVICSACGTKHEINVDFTSTTEGVKEI